MNRQYIDDHHIVARYLADRLSDAERDAFEAYYLEHPEMVQEIEATARFKAGLAQLRDSGELAALLKPAPWYARWKYVAIAAAIIIAFGAVLMLRTPPPPVMATDLEALGKAATIASSHTVLRRRDVTFDAELTLPNVAQAIEVRVLPEFAAPDARYRISLATIDANDAREPVAALDHLAADEDGMVTIYLNALRIEPGDYEVTLSAAEHSSRFLIRIRSAGKRIG